jgi:mannosyltransferase
VTSVLAPPLAGLRPQPGSRTARGFGGTAALLGLLGFIVSFAGSWQPSYWGDEAASVMSAERSLSSLFRMLGHVDAVHGTYYLLLHFWIDAFGASELSTRLPSAIAVGVATAGTAVLARTLINARVAVISALVFAALPRVTYMGTEARSTAASAAIAVWLTVLLVQALRSRSTRPGVRLGLWAGYAVLLAAAIYMFLDSVLLLAAHALAVLIFSTRPERRLRSAIPWMVATLAGFALAAPVIDWGLRESRQIAFIGRQPQAGLFEVAVLQWFGNAAFAVIAWALVLLAIATVFGRRGGPTSDRTMRGVLTVMLAWMLVPPAVLLFGTHFVAPMYSERYLSFCTPAVAIVIAVGISCFRASRLQVTAAVLLAALAVPTYLAQRGEFGKNGGSDWRQAAEVVQARAKPGDAVVFDETVRPSRKPRLAMHLYPAAFRGLQDVTLARPYAATSWLWDETTPISSSAARLTNTNTVWLLEYKGSAQSREDTDIRALQQLGFTVAHATTVNRTIIIEMTR